MADSLRKFIAGERGRRSRQSWHTSLAGVSPSVHIQSGPTKMVHQITPKQCYRQHNIKWRLELNMSKLFWAVYTNFWKFCNRYLLWIQNNCELNSFNSNLLPPPPHRCDTNFTYKFVTLCVEKSLAFLFYKYTRFLVKRSQGLVQLGP